MIIERHDVGKEIKGLTGMHWRALACFTVASACAHAESPPPAGFKNLNGAEIRRTLTGHTFTDEVHFSLRYQAVGVLDVTSMGKRTKRKWRVVGNELCSTDEFGEPCYEIWKNGNAVSMRPKNGALSIDGVLK